MASEIRQGVRLQLASGLSRAPASFLRTVLSRGQQGPPLPEALPKHSPKAGSVGLGSIYADRKGRAGRCSSLLPITSHKVPRAVVAMCVSEANCRHRDARALRRGPCCRAKRNWTPFWNGSAKVDSTRPWYGQDSPWSPRLLPPSCPLPVQPALCASSVLPAAGSVRSQASFRLHLTEAVSAVCAPLSASPGLRALAPTPGVPPLPLLYDSLFPPSCV